ncbi:hypothetical protein G7Z17_g370 [Cylindrodendrum hubeiense]|uniref:AB hydrolase-1 domain-containing protein n=1 Tax=Cylindrodendrum hubeiense TaxID=595255 RepID=A0A9P5LGC1_9HYPO|nr:hypothetical protein G7Z17_g370 [Cylindrodendrum hubeiense]
MDASPELFVTLPNRVRICYQTFGDPSDPAVVLISGHSCSMHQWPEDLITLFSPAGDRHYLIRFDHRDTGLSTEFPVPGGYTLSDMAGDVEGLIDHLDLPSKGFHLVGASMGGPLANIVATRRPEQVRSLTLLYTSPGVNAERPLKQGAMGLAADPISIGISNFRQKYIENEMKLRAALATQPPSEEERRENEVQIAKSMDRELRGGTLHSKGPNHGAASFAGWPGVEMLKDIKCPATVIQGAKDQFFGVVHGEALAKGIPDAEYLLWEDVGHELPKRVWSRFAEVLLRTWKKGDDGSTRDSETKE